MLTFAGIILIAACSAADIGPAEPDQSSQCAGCRMTVSDLRFATQLVAPGEEPRFFDDIGCMRKYVAKHGSEAPWTGFVSDYRAKQWIPAAKAEYWMCPSIETPMSSHIVTLPAGAEKPAADCEAMTLDDIWGESGAPDGEKRNQ